MLQGDVLSTSCNSRIKDVPDALRAPGFPAARVINGSTQNAATADTFAMFHRTVCHTIAGPSRFRSAQRNNAENSLEGYQVNITDRWRRSLKFECSDRKTKLFRIEKIKSSNSGLENCKHSASGKCKDSYVKRAI